MEQLRKKGKMYGGFDNNGEYRQCKFDYHKDNEMLKPGTANAIAHSLGFQNVEEMKKYIDENIK